MPTLETAIQALREVIAETEDEIPAQGADGDGFAEEMEERVAELRFLLDHLTKPAADAAFHDPKAIKRGDFDHLEAPHTCAELLVGICEAHRLAWRKTRRRSHTSHDAKALKQMLKPASLGGEGRLPSEVAKAILGMTMEPSRGDFDRAKYIDWTHVRRRFDHWLDLYAEHAGRRPPRETQGAQPDVSEDELPAWVRGVAS